MFLMGVLAAPTTFLLLPQKANAQWAVFETNPAVFVSDTTTAVKTTYSAIEDTLNTVSTFTNTAANYANYINTYVLQPLAFVMSGQLMKALTQSVLKYVIGQANGTGIPQFTVDVQKSLRSISDLKAQAYFRQVSLTNSPFATSIAQALGVDYNQKTSLAGYWAANLCTLGQNIPNYNQNYLSGNWGNGGIAAWFQLTTQSQNNPYILYQNSQAQLASVIGPGVGGATGARLNQLSWGQGFMSWCGANPAGGTNTTGANLQKCIASCNGEQSCLDDCQLGAAGTTGVNPGDPCTDPNTGKTGTIQTPGSTIKATLDKVLGGQQDKLVQIGNISSQVQGILGNIGTVLNTINLAANILGGSSSGGLLNAGSAGGAIAQSNSTGSGSLPSSSLNYFGSTGSQITQSAAGSDVTAAHNVDANAAVAAIPGAGGGAVAAVADDMKQRVAQYQNAWAAIASAAQNAKTALQTEINTCHTYFGNVSSYENDAQNAISFSVLPVLTQASSTQAIADAALKQYALVNGETPASSTFQADVDKLNSMSPTKAETTQAVSDATATGGATANPSGSLTVSGGSLVDQMKLIANDAFGIQSLYCTYQSNPGGA